METPFAHLEMTTKKHAPKWILYTGLTLFCLSYIYINIYIAEAVDDSNQPINQLLHILPQSALWLIVVFLQPAVEEMAFRGWLAGKKYTRVLSLLLILLFSYESLHLPVAACLMLPMSYLLLSPPTYAKKIITLLITSLLFGLIHIPNYNQLTVQIPVVVTLFSFSLIASYLAWRWHLLAAIGLHILNNAVALLSSSHHQSAVWNEGVQHLSVTYTVCEEGNNELMLYPGTDSISFCGDAKIFILRYINTFLNPSDFTTYFDNPGRTVTVNAVIGTDETARARFLQTATRTLHLTIDTSQMPFFHLRYPAAGDTIVIHKKEIEPSKWPTWVMNMTDFKEFINGQYHIKIHTDERDSATMIRFSSKLGWSTEKADFIRLLNMHQLFLSADSAQMTSLLTIKDTGQ